MAKKVTDKTVKKVVKKTTTRRTRRLYTEEERVKYALEIIEDIANNGKATIQAVKDHNTIGRGVFYDVIDSNAEINDKYTRARESAMEILELQAFNIASTVIVSEEEKKGFDDIKGPWNETKKYDNVQRSKLMLDALERRIQRMASKNRKEDKKEKETDKVPAHITVEVVAPKHNIDDITPEKY